MTESRAMNDSRSSSVTGVRHALVAAATLGLLSAVADWIWFRFLKDGALLPALVHGLVFFVAIALLLAPSGKTAGQTSEQPERASSTVVARRLLLTLPLVGVGLAAVFYPVAAVTGYLGALLITWAGMWIAVASLLRWAARLAQTPRDAVLRGLLAAALSGAAFATVSWMWTAPAPDGPSVPLHFVCWTWALLPGFAALLIRRSAGPSKLSD